MRPTEKLTTEWELLQAPSANLVRSYSYGLGLLLPWSLRLVELNSRAACLVKKGDNLQVPCCSAPAQPEQIVLVRMDALHIASVSFLVRPGGPIYKASYPSLPPRNISTLADSA